MPPNPRAPRAAVTSTEASHGTGLSELCVVLLLFVDDLGSLHTCDLLRIAIAIKFKIELCIFTIVVPIHSIEKNRNYH